MTTTNRFFGVAAGVGRKSLRDVPGDTAQKVSLRYVFGVLTDTAPIGVSLYWGELSNRSFIDGNTEDEEITINSVPSTAFLQTADHTVGDVQRFKQATYLHSFFEKTETEYVDVEDEPVLDNQSGCLSTACWDWQDTSTGNRWSLPQSAYRLTARLTQEQLDALVEPTIGETFDIGVGVVYTKLKVRGKGRSLSLRYESVEGKDFRLLGYSLPITANAV